MSTMDSQIESALASDFERFIGFPQDREQNLPPVNIDANLVKNFLASTGEIAGEPGPFSNMLSMLEKKDHA